jgi:hypothetical protein
MLSLMKWSHLYMSIWLVLFFGVWAAFPHFPGEGPVEMAGYMLLTAGLAVIVWGPLVGFLRGDRFTSLRRHLGLPDD